MCNRLKSGFGAFFRIWRIFQDLRRSRTRNRDLRVLTVGAHEHEHLQIPIFCHERLKSIFFATECSRWALMAKYRDLKVLMFMGAHREHLRSQFLVRERLKSKKMRQIPKNAPNPDLSRLHMKTSQVSISPGVNLKYLESKIFWDTYKRIVRYLIQK